MKNHKLISVLLVSMLNMNCASQKTNMETPDSLDVNISQTLKKIEYVNTINSNLTNIPKFEVPTDKNSNLYNAAINILETKIKKHDNTWIDEVAKLEFKESTTCSSLNNLDKTTASTIGFVSELNYITDSLNKEKSISKRFQVANFFTQLRNCDLEPLELMTFAFISKNIIVNGFQGIQIDKLSPNEINQLKTLKETVSKYQPKSIESRTVQVSDLKTGYLITNDSTTSSPPSDLEKLLIKTNNEINVESLKKIIAEHLNQTNYNKLETITTKITKEGEAAFKNILKSLGLKNERIKLSDLTANNSKSQKFINKLSKDTKTIENSKGKISADDLAKVYYYSSLASISDLYKSNLAQKLQKNDDEIKVALDKM